MGDHIWLQVCLAGFNWTQLSLISSSAAGGEHFIPIEP